MSYSSVDSGIVVLPSGNVQVYSEDVVEPSPRMLPSSSTTRLI
jgi:hypothetical protein